MEKVAFGMMDPTLDAITLYCLHLSPLLTLLLPLALPLYNVRLIQLEKRVFIFGSALICD